MTQIDRLLQRWRIRKALPHIAIGGHVIDVGAHQGELFKILGTKLGKGFGIEPLLTGEVRSSSYRIYAGRFPTIRPEEGGWDAIVMLAVLEHIPRGEQAELPQVCHDLLKPGGRLIITVPSKEVDRILALLKTAKMIDGMSLGEHFDFEPKEVPRIFAPPHFRLVCYERFQIGLNNLFVFEKQLSMPPQKGEGGAEILNRGEDVNGAIDYKDRGVGSASGCKHNPNSSPEGFARHVRNMLRLLQSVEWLNVVAKPSWK